MLANDAHASIRTVDAPPPPLVEMEVFTDPDLSISLSEADAAKGHVRLVVKSFNPELTFTNQERDTIATAVVYLEAHVPKLAACKRSWGACALLARSVNNRTTYWKARRAIRARAALVAAAGAAAPGAATGMGVASVVAPSRSPTATPAPVPAAASASVAAAAAAGAVAAATAAAAAAAQPTAEEMFSRLQ